MDFVAELTLSEALNAILVITDRFTKVQRYLPARTTWTVAVVTNAYMHEIRRLHELPRQISFDSGPQFASKFFRNLNGELAINLRLSTAYYPVTDGLRKRTVQPLKHYLAIYNHDWHTRWRACLPLAEFAYNGTCTTSHVYSANRTSYGLKPRTIHLDKDYKLASPAS